MALRQFGAVCTAHPLATIAVATGGQMTESDTDFLSRMFSQSAVPQGQAAHPDMTRLLALAAEAVRLRDALERAIDVLDHHRHHYDADYFRSQKESTP